MGSTTGGLRCPIQRVQLQHLPGSRYPGLECVCGDGEPGDQHLHREASLIGKVNLSLLALPLYIVASETVVYLISMAFFTGFLIIIGFPFSWHWCLIPLLFLAQQLFAYGLGFLLAVLSVFIRDIREFVNVFLQLWFWLTPIVYGCTFFRKRRNPFFPGIPCFNGRILSRCHTQPYGAGAIRTAGDRCTGDDLLGVGRFLFKKLEKTSGISFKP